MSSRRSAPATSEPSTAPAASSLLGAGAARIAAGVAAGQWTAKEVLQAHLDHIAAVNPQINALVVPTFDAALRDAEACDARLARGEPARPLEGVPVSIKECYRLAGVMTTLGRRGYVEPPAAEDALLVQRLRQAGAVVLGKGNVPLLMVLHDTDNPLFGRTNNPWNLARSPGGSSGGDAALVAAGGAALGLANDLGGSIRIPAHYCGIAGLKPTSRLLPKTGSAANLRGMESVQFQPGPLARHVADLTLALRVLADGPPAASDFDQAPVRWGDPAAVSISSLRIAVWEDDGFFPASTACRRAVREGAAALRAAGATVETFTPPDVEQAITLYFGLLSADGGADLRQLAAGSASDRRVTRLIRLAGVSRRLRPLLGWLLELGGDRQLARIFKGAGPRSASGYWRLVAQRAEYVRNFQRQLREGGFDAFLTPPHALPAPWHGYGGDLMPAASYAILPNLLGVPVGVVPATRVRPEEQAGRPASRDSVERVAAKVDDQSAGLPVGLQVAASHWREDVALAVMQTLEDHFRQQPDFPQELPLSSPAG